MITPCIIHGSLARHVLLVAIEDDVTEAAQFVIEADGEDDVTSARYLAAINMVETFALHYMAASGPTASRPFQSTADAQPTIKAHDSMRSQGELSIFPAAKRR